MAAVLVHIDLDGERPHASSLVALAAGRQIASSWGATLYAALIAHDDTGGAGPDSALNAGKVAGIDSIESTLSRVGADKVVVAMTDVDVQPLWAFVGSAWQGVLDQLRPRLVLFGADSPSAAELGPRTGARIGARLLLRARAIGTDQVELRDRDGRFVRMEDSGAVVALVGRAERPSNLQDEDIDVVVLALPGGADAGVELVGNSPAEVAHTTRTLVALGDDAAADQAIVDDARSLAVLLDAPIVGGRGAARVLPGGAIVDRTTPVCPELCIAIGNAKLDVAGATSVIKVGGRADKTVDGVIAGPAAVGVAELVKRLEPA